MKQTITNFPTAPPIKERVFTVWVADPDGEMTLTQFRVKQPDEPRQSEIYNLPIAA